MRKLVSHGGRPALRSIRDRNADTAISRLPARGGPRETLRPVRDALGADADLVEEAKLLSATPYEHLPPAAIARLGARPGQRNLLVRVVLADLGTTLTNAAANVLRDRVYEALHQGTPPA